MDLYDDIERATRIPFTDGNASFVPLKGPSQAMRDRRMNDRRLRPPRNLNLVESDGEADSVEGTEEEAEIVRRVLNPHEIAASIKAANGGLDYSNEFLERHWRSVRRNVNSSSESLCETRSKNDVSSPSNCSTGSVGSGNSNDNFERPTAERAATASGTVNAADSEEVLKRCRLSRNAAIRGLVRQKKILIEDLEIPGDQTRETPKIDLVPCPEDPDILVQPLLAYGKVDESRCEGIDFTVGHVGRKEKVTPRQFYLSQNDDSFFEFVKREPRRDK